MSPLIPPIQQTSRRIDVLAFPDVQLLDVAGPFQAFATANRLAQEAGHPEPYRLTLVAPGGGPVLSSAPLGLIAEPLPAPETPLDTLVVAGGAGARTEPDHPLVEWIARRAEVARRVASVCTGAFLLAAAGLLDGKRAVTHWAQCDELAAAFPKVRVQPDPIFINEGAIWTSAGVTAGIDLTLALIEADLGRAAATAVARQLVVFAKRPGGQAQFSAGLALTGADDRFDALHGWINGNLRGDLGVPALADQAGMSERNFLRRYREVTGMTPARAVERLRVEAARQALGGTCLPLKRIARDCGFGSEETMRRSFLRVLSVPPNAYRERFPV